MNEPETTRTDPLYEELSAYLDGELDAEGVCRVEERLARDPAYQAELQRLERAWGLLDGLPRAAVNEDFTKSTIEMVALAASEDAQATLADQPRRRRRQRLLGAGAMVLAAALGFVIGTQLWPDPNRKLLDDLPVVQNFDHYYQVDDIEFLRMLEQHGLFLEEDTDRVD